MKKQQKELLIKQLNEASKNIKIENNKVINLNKIKDQEAKLLTEWKTQKAVEIDIREFNIPKRLIRVSLNTKEYHALILYGEGGLGKTFLTINEVKGILKPDKWSYYNGYSTPLSIYEILYLNRNKKLVILDDIEGLFCNPIAVSILKGALWDSNGKRLVQYNSKSEKAENLPSTFEIKAKLIILCNKIPNSDDVTINALISRTLPYEVSFSYQQKIEILEKMVNSREDLTAKQKENCIEIIKKETTIATKNLSFRTLRKVIAFVKEDKKNAVDLFKATTEKDEDVEIVFELMKKGLDIDKQIQQFCDKTGKSRATFYRIKKKIISKSDGEVADKKSG